MNSKIFRDNVKELVGAYGWIPAYSKLAHMISFIKEEGEVRMNLYITTGTVTIQEKYQPCRTYRDIHDLTELEEILQ